jgi:hypothetical protein
MRRSMIKRIILLSLALFFLAGLAIAFNYYDDAFSLTSRSICKIKAASSGTLSKSKSPFAKAVAVVYLGVAELPLLTAVVAENKIIFIASQSAYIWPNKAPPVNS